MRRRRPPDYEDSAPVWRSAVVSSPPHPPIGIIPAPASPRRPKSSGPPDQCRKGYSKKELQRMNLLVYAAEPCGSELPGFYLWTLALILDRQFATSARDALHREGEASS